MSKPFWETNKNPIIMKHYPPYTAPEGEEREKINTKKRKNYETLKNIKQGITEGI